MQSYASIKTFSLKMKQQQAISERKRKKIFLRGVFMLVHTCSIAILQHPLQILTLSSLPLGE